MKVQEVMTTPVITVTEAAPFPELVDRMVRHGISGLPVTDEDGRLVGIVTEADLVSKEAYGGHRRRALEVLGDLVAGGQTRWAIKAKGRTAGQVMTQDVTVVGPRDDVRVAARVMVEAGVKRLPVVEQGRLVGIVSRPDLLRVLHRTDAEIEADLTQMLLDPFRVPEGHAVAVAVDDGVVELTGTVELAADVPLMTSVAWQVPGVVDVRNLLTAREDGR